MAIMLTIVIRRGNGTDLSVADRHRGPLASEKSDSKLWNFTECRPPTLTSGVTTASDICRPCYVW